MADNTPMSSERCLQSVLGGTSPGCGYRAEGR